MRPIRCINNRRGIGERGKEEEEENSGKSGFSFF